MRPARLSRTELRLSRPAAAAVQPAARRTVLLCVKLHIDREIIIIIIIDVVCEVAC
jgi:hypothetical protein